MEIKTGDLIQIGPHRLLCGDCTKAEDVEKLLGDIKIDLILVDAPYGCAVVEKEESFTGKTSKHKKIRNDNITNEDDYLVFTESWMKHVGPRTAEKNAVYMFCIDRMTFPIRTAMESAGFRFTQILIWLKTQVVVGRLDYIPQTELIVYGWYGKHGFYKAKDKNVLVCPKPARSKGHATIKPSSLLRRLILNSSKVGSIVYDGFLGSGSTMLAAEQTKRVCYGIEIEPEYCQLIVDRMEKLTGLTATKVTD